MEPRARILEAAQAELLENGADGLSLRAVARRAGYSPASLYEHFDGRDAILQALADEADAALRGRLEAAIAGKRRAALMLLPLGCAYVEFAQREPAAFQVLFHRLPSRRRSPEEAPRPGSSAELLHRTVAAALAEAGRPAREVETVALGLWSLAHGLAVLGTSHLAALDLRAAATAILKPAIRGWLS